MGLLGSLGRLFGKGEDNGGLSVADLGERLGVDAQDLASVKPSYKVFEVRKRSGGKRTISAPDPELKKLQKTILRRLLDRLKVHPNAVGFERGYSIVSNAYLHVGSAVVVNLDVRDFFGSTSEKRLAQYLKDVGWGKEARDLLVKICTHKGSLPQGAPTSPRLSNLVNYRMDARLAGLAGKFDAKYSRYADDVTFSFSKDNGESIHAVIRSAKAIMADYGYKIHHRKKLTIRRQYERQEVTGLVVNRRVALPRTTRRWLRSVEHHVATGKPASLNEHQIKGWRALQKMIETQSAALGGPKA